MTLDFVETTLEFEGQGRQTAQNIVGNVETSGWVTAEAAIKGFEAKYTDTDHHVKKIQASVDTPFQAPKNFTSGPLAWWVKGYLHIRDKNDDDKFKGWIKV